jgi:hypothetical protein
MIIKPTVGRVVWYYPDASDRTHNGSPVQSLDKAVPFAATVTYVQGDDSVNLAGVDHVGTPFTRLYAYLAQEGEPRPSGGYACWMPYQTSQARKHAAEETPQPEALSGSAEPQPDPAT